jgi:hypothetical membrane protein
VGLIEKFDRLYNIFSKPYLILLVIFTPSLTVAISTLLYITIDPTFSILTHYLSDIGAGPNGAGLIFNAGMILSSFIMVAFYIHLSLIILKKGGYKFLVLISFICGIISSLGIFLIAIFPVNVNQEIHNFTATFFFMGGWAAAIFITLTEFLTPNFSRIQAFSGIVVIGFFVLFIVFNALHYFNPNDGWSEISHITEWILFIGLILWVVEHGIFTFKIKLNFLKINKKN